MLVFLLATAAAQETPIGRYLAYQRRALDEIGKTCAYKHFLLKHDQNCAGLRTDPRRTRRCPRRAAACSNNAASDPSS